MSSKAARPKNWKDLGEFNEGLRGQARAGGPAWRLALRGAGEAPRGADGRVGGPAEVLFRPADKDDLTTFLQELPREVAVTMLGVGSNILIRDGGIPGVSIRLGDGFSGIKTIGAIPKSGKYLVNLTHLCTPGPPAGGQ